MSVLRRLSACVLATLLLAGGAGVAAAEQPAAGASGSSGGRIAPVAVAVVDVQALLQQSLAAQSIQRQLESERERFQTQIQQQQEQLKATEQQLATQRTAMTPDAFDARRKDFERQVQEFQGKLDGRKQALDKAFSESMNQLRDNMLSVVQQVAAERGVTLVLPTQAILYLADKSLDITETVLQRLNTKLPQVAVKLPK
jgi:Skp family chaperone for outer membrane proteins